MKRTHIVILIAIAIGIGTLIMMSVDFSTYDTIASARAKQGKFVHMIARIDKTVPLDYNPAKDPNYLSFVATDSVGEKTRVIYHDTKPPELEQTDRIVLEGRMEGDVFECKNILLKCPSKYKDDKKVLEKTISKTDY